jgi:hypothetical protein
MINLEIDIAGFSTLQAILIGFAAAKIEGLTSQELVAAIINRELTLTEASNLAELEWEQRDTIENIVGSPAPH